jgi:hypothetical protein
MMNYDMTTPCDACPFLRGSGFKMKQLRAYASGEFGCHKACDLKEDEEGSSEYREKPGNKTPHCAGALLFLEKRNQPHQMMRIAERLGMYDHTKLDKSADVV